jgi:tetratricopeptide (TPR) repeat protein
MNTDKPIEDTEQDEFISYVKNALEQVQAAKTKEAKEHHLFSLLAYLISTSNDIADKGDIYEAAGRLYSAAYYLEEFHPKEARQVYTKSNEYYMKFFSQSVKMGNVEEAANIALKIAAICREKLVEENEANAYHNKAISLIEKQIEIIKEVGSPREICAKFQTLAMLYAKLKNWLKVIENAEYALELAKAIKDYSISANSYFDIAAAYEQISENKKAQNLIVEAMDYFFKEAADYEAKQELLPLSQLYQIIKNIYGQLRNPNKFQLYSRKEAGVYIAMAKLSLLYNSSNAQIASYYRGAALCYRETRQNELDAASCFVLAGNYYTEGKKFLEAAINYEDAAKSFEKISKYKKAYEMYIKAGELAQRGKSYQPAIENLMCAYDMTLKEDLDSRRVLSLLIKSLAELAKIEEAADNHYVAATLYLEAAKYSSKRGEPDKEELDNFQNRALMNYWSAAESKYELEKKTMISYAYALSAMIARLLNRSDIVEKATNFLMNNHSKTATAYAQLLEFLSPCLANRQECRINGLDKKLAKLLESSEEMRIIFEIIKTPLIFTPPNSTLDS